MNAVFVACLLLLMLIFRIIGSVRLRETLAGIQRRQQIASEHNSERCQFEESQLHFIKANTFDQWWASVCLASTKLNFAAVTLLLTNRDGSQRTLVWQNPDILASERLIDMRVLIPDRRDNS